MSRGYEAGRRGALTRGSMPSMCLGITSEEEPRRAADLAGEGMLRSLATVTSYLYNEKIQYMSF